MSVDTGECLSSISYINTKISKAEEILNKYKGESNLLSMQIQNNEQEIDKLNYEISINEKAAIILEQAGAESRELARTNFEKIVTEALQYVTQSDDYKFIIQDNTSKSGKPAYNVYIQTTVNGETSLQDPMEANGGGFVDIISVAAKYAYLELYNNPGVKNSSVIFDEPGKMIDDQRSINFAKYIKELGKAYNKQTIMVTHNANLVGIADKTFHVSQDIFMKSHVSDVDDVMPLNTIESIVKEELADEHKVQEQ